MSMIFDRFQTRDRAEAFASEIERVTGLETQVFDTEEEAFEHDPFPFDLNGFIVHVDRSEDYDVETAVHRIAPEYGGVFSGT